MGVWKWLVGLIGLGVTACTLFGSEPTSVATLTDANGKAIGTVRFVESAAGTRISVSVMAVVPGKHGTHVHTLGACNDTTDASGNTVKFGGAGAHFDPLETRLHGKPEHDETQAHAGVMPNTLVDASGVGTMSFTTRKLRVSGGPLSVIGRSVILHALEDDHSTQPTGNSGPRIACGVIVKG